ncbi:MAG TPA: C1 family peptidase [Tenuifilaceae bacterium]|nr:C1 family peptidase [Tenuifilaceae bacterium]
MRKLHLLIITVSVFVLSQLNANGQIDNGYNFEVVKQVKTTPVKDQQRTGTCWSFATTSFIETELLRMNKTEIILSPMFFVRHAYLTKAERFVRFQGTINFDRGGQAHDVVDVVRNFGIIPEQYFSGKNYGEEEHVHSELNAMLIAMADVVIKNKNRTLSTAWQPAIESVVDSYLGKIPEVFEYEGKKYSPKEFSRYMGINPDDYVELTSFNHHPYYQSVILEIPDNWSHKTYYNVPIDELILVMNNAIENGYTVCWDGDTSEKGFAYSKGLAVLPQAKVEEMSDSEQAKWSNVPKDSLTMKLFSFSEIVPEIKVTELYRQQTFDNYQTTDDHLMHIVGISKDTNGTQYFITKNSWGTDDHIYDGYLHMSEQYVRGKTIAVLLHKDALPKDIAIKIGLK